MHSTINTQTTSKSPTFYLETGKEVRLSFFRLIICLSHTLKDTPADPNSMDDEFFKVYNNELKECDPGSSAVVVVSGESQRDGLKTLADEMAFPAPPKMLKKIAGPRLGNQKQGFKDQGELKGLLKGLKYKPNQVPSF